METKKIKSQLLQREATIEVVERAEGEGNGKIREVRLSLSSETPVDQWFGREILIHEKGAVRLNRMNNGAPLLLNHNTDRQVGVFKRGTVVVGEDKKLRGVARFSRHAQEVADDVEDDVRTLTSVGYRVHAMERARELEELDDKGQPKVLVYRVTDWEPMEASIVAVPADPTVGKGRMFELEHEITITDPGPRPNPDAPMEGTRSMEPTITTTITAAPPAPAAPVNMEILRAEVAQSERTRISEIDAIAAKFSLKEELVRNAKDKGTSSADFARLVIDNWNPSMIRTVDPRIGMSRKEISSFSIARCGAAIVRGSWDKAGLEREMTIEARKKNLEAGCMDRGPMSFTVPFEVGFGQRDYLAQSGEGPELVETQLRSQDFIEMLRPASVCIQAGAMTLPGLVGNVNFPRQSAGTTFGWVTEGATTAESTGTLDVLSFTPKTINGFSDVSRQLLLQSTPSADKLLRNDFTLGIGTQLDIAGIRGPGTGGSPTGILATAGIGDVDFGTNGGAPTNAFMVAFLVAVANANALLGSLGWAVNPNTMGKLMNVEKFANSGIPMWQDKESPMYGYKGFVTTNLRATLTKGSGTALSEMIFGNWAELMIGFWGGLDVLVDPYTASTLGNVRFVGFQSADCGLRHAGSFCGANEVITA